MPFVGKRTSKRRKKSALEQEFELTQAAQATGVESAPEDPAQSLGGRIWQATKAAGGAVAGSPITRTILDTLSRPNYAAVAGTEALLGGQGMPGAAAAAGQEILSGIPGVEGQKKTFGKLLEERGVGTHTAGEGFAALRRQGVPLPLGIEQSWVGGLGTRGATGLVLDVGLDPSTYLTFGASSAAKTPFRSGARFLSKAGRTELAEIRSGIRGRFARQMDEAVEAGDNVAVSEIARKVDDEAEDEFLAKFVDNDDTLPSRLTDPGGVKFAGLTVIPQSVFRSIGRPVGAAAGATGRGTLALIRAVPGGKAVVEKTAAFARGLGDTSSEMLDPFASLAPLKRENPAMYERAKQLHRDTVDARAAEHARLKGLVVAGDERLGIEPDLRNRWVDAAAKDERLGEKMTSIREGKPSPANEVQYTIQDLSPAQQQLYREWAAIYDHLRAPMIRRGVFTEAELPENYFPRFYENIDSLREVHATSPHRFDNRVGGSFLKERVFESVYDAVKTTRKSNEMGKRKMLTERARGGLDPVVRPELIPRYDLLENYDNYISKYSDTLARSAWNEQVIKDFGVPTGTKFAAEDIWHHTTWAGSYDNVPKADIRPIAEFFQGNARVSPLDKGWDDLLEDEAERMGKRVGRSATEESLMDRAASTLKGLSPEGRKTMISRLLSAVRSESQAARIANDLYDDFGGSFPSFLHNSDEIASLSYERMYGKGIEPVLVNSSLITGGVEYRIPRPIFDDLTKLDRDILMTASKSEAVRSVIRGYDKFTAYARLGVYGGWIPSMVRDKYNNVALSMFDIGLGALNPRRAVTMARVLAGSDGALKVAGGGSYTFRELNAMAKAMGVVVPGKVFAEGLAQTSKAGRRVGKLAKAGEKFFEARGLVDNSSRMGLWLANIERGVAPREAARHVKDYLFDYAELSPFARSYLRRFFFFPTFTLKNVPFWARELRRKPGLAINQLKPFRADQEEREALAEWQADQLRIRLDKDGRTIHVLQGIDMPIKNLDTLWGGGLNKTARGIASMLAPIPRTALEQVGGTNLLTGRPMNRTQSQAMGAAFDKTGAPKWLKDFMGYAKEYDEAGRPKYTFNERKFALLIRSWAFSRVVSTLDRAWKEDIEKLDKSALELLIESAVVGIRYNEVNLDEATQKKIESRVRDLREKLRERGYAKSKPERELQ